MRHLAQVNIGLPVEPLDTPRLAEFVGALDRINALADTAEGFVWRLQTEDGDATAVRAFDDERLIINMSVWRSLESLAAYVYQGEHARIMRRRREWFVPMREAYQVLWWLPAGQLPTVTDATHRLEYLRRHGPSGYAFTFRHPFPAADGESSAASDSWFCRA
jgi:uncharacterized protein DUF3291